MARCQKCGEPDVNNSGRCKKHPKTPQEIQKEKREKDLKLQMEKKRADEEEERKKLATKAQKQREDQANKSKKISEIAKKWNQEVNKIVNHVLQIRKANPGISGINAGDNGPRGRTDGGSTNPLRLDLPSNDYNITKAEVFRTMNGFDSSDSGLYKFRRDDKIFVHCR